MAVNEHTMDLLEALLGAIGTDANALRNSVYREDSGNAHIHAIVAEKIGWMADLGLKAICGSPLVSGDAEEWFMCQDYIKALHKAKEMDHE